MSFGLEGDGIRGPEDEADLSYIDTIICTCRRFVPTDDISGSPRPAITGTSIVLETDEDIARWIAERKARWPTSSRVAQKASRQGPVMTLRQAWG